MRAYELHPSQGFDCVRLVERPVVALGPRDVRVRVHAVSLNYRDLTIATTPHMWPSGASIVPCSDGAGEVVEIGSAVTRLAIGDRVAGVFFPDWLDGEFRGEYRQNALGGGADGMLCEEKVLPEHSWVTLPADLSFEEAATLPCAALTAYDALFEVGRIGPGSTVLAQGTGGVSVFTLQLAKAAGARVVMTSKHAEKREHARRLGADHVIDYVATPLWGEAAWRWTGDRGVDLVVEVGGVGTFEQSMAAVRYGGTVAIIGGLSGRAGALNLMGFVHKSATVRGITVGSRRMFEALNRAIEAIQLRPVIDRVFGFDEARAAYEYQASGAHFGKVVIRVC